jgi:hypothetical protein
MKVSGQLNAARVLSEFFLEGKSLVINGNQIRIPWSTSLLSTCWTIYSTHYILIHIWNDLNSNGIYAHSIYAHSIYAHSTYAHSTYAHSTYAHSTYAHSIYAHSTYAHSIYAHSIYAHSIYVHSIYLGANHHGRAVKDVCLRLLDSWGRGFETHWGHGCLSIVFVV